MFEANPRQQPSETKRIPVTAIGKRNLSLARISHIRQQSLTGVGNYHWRTDEIPWHESCRRWQQSLLAWQMESLKSWLWRQSSLARRDSRWNTGGVGDLQAWSWTVRQLQAVWLETGQKRTRYSFFSLQEQRVLGTHYELFCTTALFGVV